MNFNQMIQRLVEKNIFTSLIINSFKRLKVRGINCTLDLTNSFQNLHSHFFYLIVIKFSK